MEAIASGVLLSLHIHDLGYRAFSRNRRAVSPVPVNSIEELLFAGQMFLFQGIAGALYKLSMILKELFMGFRLANIDGRASLVLKEHYYDIETISGGELTSDLMLALGAASNLSSLSGSLQEHKPAGKLADVQLGPPVPRPSNCYAIGLNYRKHAEESTLEIPPVPMVFTKHSNCITGPEGEIEMRSDFVDYEAELVVVIGEPGKDISPDVAWKHVFGLCVGQDISDRPVQFSAGPPQFNLGKSFDTFGPIGPWLTSPDALKDRNSMEIICKVNDELRQKDNTSDLIFDIPTLISYLSEIVTLDTGDLIFTGTPDGVGAIPGNYLCDGDVLITSIDGLGTLRNKCVRISDHSRAEVMPDALAKLLTAARTKASAKEEK